MGVVAIIVEGIVRERIGHAQERTIHGKHSLTIVIAWEAHVVHHDVALAIAEISRVDGSDVVDQREDRTRVTRLSFSIHVVALRVGVGDVGVEVEPIFRIPVSLQTRSDTLEVCILEDTFVVQVTH